MAWKMLHVRLTLVESQTSLTQEPLSLKQPRQQKTGLVNKKHRQICAMEHDKGVEYVKSNSSHIITLFLFVCHTYSIARH